MLEPNLIEKDYIPESSSREIIKNPEQKRDIKKDNINNKDIEKDKEKIMKITKNL